MLSPYGTKAKAWLVLLFGEKQCLMLISALCPLHSMCQQSVWQRRSCHFNNVLHHTDKWDSWLQINGIPVMQQWGLQTLNNEEVKPMSPTHTGWTWNWAKNSLLQSCHQTCATVLLFFITWSQGSTTNQCNSYLSHHTITWEKVVWLNY